MNNLEIARAYLKAIEDRADAHRFFASDVVQEEFPNRLVPNGAKRDLAALKDGAEKGRKVMTAERYTVKNAVAQGDVVALEVLWEGTLAIPLGSLPVGGVMRAHFGVFLTFCDGKIVQQHNYDCFEPW